MKRLKEFWASPYFNPVAIVLFSLIGGFAIALFPYNDLSVKRMIAPAVVLVAGSTAALAFIVIVWIMGVSFFLDRKYDWHVRGSGRYSRQILFGGLVSLMMIILYQLLFYGRQLIDSEAYYFVFALQLFMLYLINERGYMVYLAQRTKQCGESLRRLDQEKQKADLDLHLLSEKYAHSEQRVTALQQRESELEQQLLALQTPGQTVQESILEKYMMMERFLFGARESNPYVLRIGSKELHIAESQIVGFEIEGGNNRKPFIYVVTVDGNRFLTTEESLESLHQDKYPAFFRLNRQLLVSPQSLLRYEAHGGDGGCWLYTTMASEPVFLSKAKWSALSDRIKMVLAWSQLAS